MKIAKIEWRLRAVTRYLLTRYEQPEQPTDGIYRYGTTVQPCGEYDNLQLATEVGHALAAMDVEKHKHVQPPIPVSFDDINLPAPRVRAKMTCVSAWPSRDGEGKPADGGQVTMTAVYESGAEDGGNAAMENRIFSKATPNALIQMQVNNPEAFARFKAGQVYYVDFIPVPQEGELLPSGDL